MTRALADSLETTLVSNLGGASVVRRNIGTNPLPATTWADAVFGPYTPAENQTPRQREAIALAHELADELINADAFIFAVPFYNYGVSQHFKAWVDVVFSEPRFTPGGESPIAGRPAQLVVARGGGYGPGTPRHGWDHGTAWYRRVLEDIWKLDVQVVECELTLADVTPAMEGLRPQAAENLATAHAQAQDNAIQLARRLAA